MEPIYVMFPLTSVANAVDWNIKSVMAMLKIIRFTCKLFRWGSTIVLRPVAFRPPISRVLAFSWTYEHIHQPIYVCKNRANSNIYAYIAWDVKDIKRLNQLGEEGSHSKSHKKLCNSGVNYTKSYYIIYIVL